MMLPLNLAELFAPEIPDQNLYLSLGDLVTRQEELLQESTLFRRAFESGLYRDRWKKHGVKFEHLEGRHGLQELPCIDGNDLLEMLANGNRINKALLKRPRIWLISQGISGRKKWLPLTLNDIGNWFCRMRRLNNLVGLSEMEPGKLILAINEPLPKVSNAVPYLWEQVDYQVDKARLEWIIVAMEMLPRNHWDRFAIRKQPHWFMSSVRDALRLAKEMDTGDAEDIKTALPSLERGFFWGTNLDGNENLRTELQETYGLKDSFSIYLSAECREMYAECQAHDGLHLWMDGVIHEIRLENGEIIFLDEAAPGTEGEYVLTTFYEALPLIRYRTGDRIRVIDTSPCKCGITHPRAVFLGRKDIQTGKKT